ncbi:MAG: NADH-quinone oxidoreductase subunit C [Sphingobacteriales bacterium]|jgi:NADH-quinone oxidoreductase subunit C|nr:NADH-quinone oxidoreductase subunit C [Sphingobacteriales bacterium]
MIQIDKDSLLTDLQEKFGSAVQNVVEPYGLLTFTTTKEQLLPILTYLNENDNYRFRFLTDVCGVHYPDNKQLAVIYHLHSLESNFRLRLKVFLPESNPHIPTVCKLYKSANWQERETYDFFGIIFDGHPNLKRILNVDDMVAFPMRKEYPLEDPNRIDKNDSYFGR